MTPTTPTSGAADLPEALEDFELRKMAAIGPVHESNGLVERRPIVYRRELEDQFVRGFRAAESRRVAALAAGQAVAQDDLITIRKPTTSAEMLWLLKLAHLVMTDVDKTLEESFAPAQPAAQQGVAYAALPDSPHILKETPWGTTGAFTTKCWREYPSGSGLYTVAQMRAFADATHAIRASHGQAYPTIDDLCARIKAADDAAADRDYMLDSNDCIAVLRGEWEGPLAMDKPERASHGQAPAEVSPTAGMNIPQRILHVGGRNNDAGYVEFGSIQSVEALVQQVLRDLPALAQADSVQEDAARLDWLDQQCEGYGFQDIHEGNRWGISGPYANVRQAIDYERAARKQGESND